jgi:hypothetical protein
MTGFNSPFPLPGNADPLVEVMTKCQTGKLSPGLDTGANDSLSSVQRKIHNIKRLNAAKAAANGLDRRFLECP